MAKFFTFVKKKGVETAIPPLEFLKAATEVIPVPALKPATDIMLSILEKVYQSQQNAGTGHEIANLCLRAHSTLSEHLLSVEITPALLNSIRQFEADLHDAQAIVQKYEQKMWFQHVFYSRSNKDDLQRLEKRVNNTLSLFQIKNLLSLGEINEKINASIQRVEQNTVGNTAYLQRIEQNTVVLMNQRSESAPRPEGASVDTVSGGHITLCEEIANGPGYSLQKAEMRGKAIAIKIFTGCKAKSMWEAAVKSELDVMHPNRPRVIETSRPDECAAPYLAYDLDIKDHVESVILSSMRQDHVDEVMYMCSGMIHGISSALINLSEQAHSFDLSAEGFDILWDSRGRVVLVIRPEVANFSTALASPAEAVDQLHVMDGICNNIFRSVNRIRYADKPDRPYTTIPFERVDEDTPLAGSSSQPPNATVIKPRRELRWEIAAGSNTDLRKISQEYGSFIRRNVCSRQSVRRFHAVTETTTYRGHQCKGYQREELTFTHAILNNNVVVHTLPRIDEICVICGKIVKREAGGKMRGKPQRQSKLPPATTYTIFGGKVHFAPLPDPHQQPGVDDDNDNDDESEADSPPFPPSSDTASENISGRVSLPSISSLSTPQQQPSPRASFWVFSRKKKLLGDLQASSASSSLHSLTPSQSLTGTVSLPTPRLPSLSLSRGGEKENGHALTRYSSPGSTTSADAGLWKSQSTQSYVPKQQRKGRAPPPRKTNGLLATIHTSNPAKGTRMLNGRAYGQKKAQRERNLFANAPDAEPEFNDWGYGGMGSVKSSREAGGKVWSKLQSEDRDDDDGSGMSWVKKRREERERKAREELEAKEKEQAAAQETMA